MGNTKEIAAKVEEEKAVTESKAKQPPVVETPPAVQVEIAPLTKAERIKKKAQAEIDRWNQEAIERTPEPEEVEDEE